MVKIAIYKKEENGALLSIWRCVNGDLIGCVFADGKEKRGKWDMKARFRKEDNEATEYRVCEYFGFNANKPWWVRWA